MSQRNPETQQTCLHRGSLRLTQQSWSLHGLNLGPLHTCCSCVAQCVVELLREGAAAISDTFACFGTQGKKEGLGREERENWDPGKI